MILDQQGNGQYVGCVLNIDVTDRQVNDWYGEGDDMIFIDGEPWPPRLHGTGTEDYFNTAWCPTQEYCSPYHGVILSGGPNWADRVTLYRYHIEDPIRIYLTQMGEIPMLDRTEEVAAAPMLPSFGVRRALVENLALVGLGW